MIKSESGKHKAYEFTIAGGIYDTIGRVTCKIDGLSFSSEWLDMDDAIKYLKKFNPTLAKRIIRSRKSDILDKCTRD